MQRTVSVFILAVFVLAAVVPDVSALSGGVSSPRTPAIAVGDEAAIAAKMNELGVSATDTGALSDEPDDHTGSILESEFGEEVRRGLTTATEATASVVPSLSARQKANGRVLDAFKKEEHGILFDNLPFTEEEERILFQKDQKVFSLQELIDRLQNARDQVESQKDQVTKQRLTLEEYLRQLDGEINGNEQKVEEVRMKIAATNRSIAQYTDKIRASNEKIASDREAMLDYLSHVYSQGDLVFGRDQNVDMFKTIILNDGDVSDIFSDLYYKTLIQTTGQNFVDRYRSLVSEYYYDKERLKESKKDDIALRTTLMSQQDEIEAKKQYKQRILEVTKGKEQLFDAYISQKLDIEIQARAKIQTVLAEYDDVYRGIAERFSCKDFSEIRDGESQPLDLSGTMTKEKIAALAARKTTASEECLLVKRFFDAEKKLRTEAQQGAGIPTEFGWPVNPTKGISTYYRDPDYYDRFGSDHEAIDVPAAQGSDVLAAADGYVYFILPPTTTGYSYVAVKHAGGLVTVYGHLSAVNVQLFDFVKKGQAFAKSGGAPGTAGAGPMTTGAHMHFEAFRERKSVDPLRYLDLTYLDFNGLRSKYRYKFIEDFRKRYKGQANVAKYSKFAIIGESEIERQKYLLSRFAVPAFQDWDMWVQEAVNGNVDPSFLMCVGLAESGLGRYLKTPYNVGNIGNTDSGSTYQFAGAREGISWMVRTLNNKYLRRYDTIDMLSRYGNKTGPIYASSPVNWQNNVVRCLSSLKGRFVEDDYRFRGTSE